MTREELFEAMVGIDEERLEHSEKKPKKSFRWVYLGAAAACIGLIGITANYYFVPPLLYQEEAIVESSSNLLTGISDSRKQVEDMVTGNGVQSNEQKEIGFWLNGVRYTSICYEEYEAYGLKTEASQEQADEIDSFLVQHMESVEEELSQRESIIYSGSRSKNQESAKKEEFLLEGGDLVSEKDIGEVMGIIKESEDQKLIGCIVYHYNSYPDSDRICIVKYGDSYQVYTMEITEK